MRRTIFFFPLLLLLVITVGCIKQTDDIVVPFDIEEEERQDQSQESVVDTLNINYDGDWVDLGLPSGLLWATRNVGAQSPTDFGKYYAWGEITTKSDYSWETYIYGSRYGSKYELSKYNTINFGDQNNYFYQTVGRYFSGVNDNLITLEPVDDAATVNYGGRTPTSEEWQELMNNTTRDSITINGVEGLLLVGPNGMRLFLPAAGIRSGTQYLSSSCFGSYWSSSLKTDFPAYAYYIRYDSGRVDFGEISRADGLTVRAVRNKDR